VRASAVRLPLRTGHHHVNLAAVAFGADQPGAPIGQRHLGAVALSLFGWIGLDLVAAISALYDQANAGCRRAA
jgi:hypothetical protein